MRLPKLCGDKEKEQRQTYQRLLLVSRAVVFVLHRYILLAGVWASIQSKSIESKPSGKIFIERNLCACFDEVFSSSSFPFDRIDAHRFRTRWMRRKKKRLELNMKWNDVKWTDSMFNVHLHTLRTHGMLCGVCFCLAHSDLIYTHRVFRILLIYS